MNSRHAQKLFSILILKLNSWWKFDKRQTLLIFYLSLLSSALFAGSSSDYTAAPPFVATNVGKPNVVIALDISGSMKAAAYEDKAAGHWRKSLLSNFDPANEYYGYFESDKKYSYDPDPSKEFFYEDESGIWHGDYLNWLTMRRIDVVRKVLVGGKIRDRAGESIGGSTWYILEGQNEPLDHTFRKSYDDSISKSPFDNDLEVLISDGAFSVTTGDGATIVKLSDSVEIGQISIDRDIDDEKRPGGWYTVKYKNTYSEAPAVVVTGLSYKGKNQSLARISNVTKEGFEVRVDEWDYLDGNHTTEVVTFMVAKPGDNTIEVDTLVGTQSYTVAAGKTEANQTVPNYMDVNMGTPFTIGTDPIIFTSTTTVNDEQPVTTRVKDIDSSSFKVAMQEEKSEYGSNHANEDLSWIAVEPMLGTTNYEDPAIKLALEVKKTSNVHTEAWRNINYTSNHFSKKPMIAVGMQSANGGDNAVVRYGNKKNSKSVFDVMIEEEDSNGGGDLTHPSAEQVGYFAIEKFDGYKIRVGLQTEPTGIIQENSASIRFGMAVYNYDHTVAPTSIYKNNKVNGGTFRPCYPDTSLAVSDQTNFDICLDTHVKSPLTNIITVIEDHPLIWGTTPIAETLYDIKGYFAQEDFNKGATGHTQWYDNGTEGTAGQRNSYEISQDWDPFYYPEFSARLPCAKSFVLHFNDGAPFKDFDADDAEAHPTITDDGVGKFGAQQVLDDLALELRKNDCRTDTGMTGHQEIVSYYIYAALGESEDLTKDDIRRMRESAANGGFIDEDDDNEPDPPHPANFDTYVAQESCDPNEWDSDGDCNPDTFYFANNAAMLVSQLNAAFESITARAASGGASSVIAASRSGEGAVFNAIFRPSVAKGDEEVTWIGDVHALMIDSAGHLRQDDGDKILEAPSHDKYLDMCSFNSDDLKEVRIKLSSTLEDRPTMQQAADCEATVYSKTLFDIEYLWSGATWLSAMSDSEAADAQRSYTSTGKGRYILTGSDYDGNGIITRYEVVDFLTSKFSSWNSGLVASTEADAHDVINFIRGKEIAGFRSRQLDGKTQRLGDLIYSTPTVVGRPAENLDLIYGSPSYRRFFDHYRYRRQVVYAGGNDGMLHAFNGGWYDPDTKEFKTAHGNSAAGSTTAYDLGAELWAYVPYNGLPHLEYLTRPSYGSVSSDHIYFMDLEPRVFDARIFADDDDHPGGWGTILVVGSRLGGGQMTVDIDVTAGTNVKTLQSSIAIIDVTNPDKPPQVLLEYTHPDLGFTTAIPAPVVVGSDSDGNGDWYLMLGSGADTDAAGFDDVKSTQKAKLYLLDLKEIVANSTNPLEANFGTSGIYTLPDDNSFVSDLSSVDFGFDNFTTDAVYFGTVSGDSSAGWAGKIYRVKIQSATGAEQASVSTWTASQVIDAGRPVTSAISISTDGLKNRWLHAGTGRFFTRTDNLDSSANYYYGLKEPRNTSGVFTYASPTNLVNVSSVEVKTATGVLDPLPTLSPELSEGTTVTNFSRRMKAYSDSQLYVDGWRRNLAAGERNFGAPAALGGTLSYTTYNPVFDECSIEGTARLYVLNMFTGTAGEPPILNQSDNETVNRYSIELGSNPATTPSLHVGEGYQTKSKSTAIIQTSDGSIITVEQTNKSSVRSGEVSWRELQ